MGLPNPRGSSTSQFAQHNPKFEREVAALSVE